MASSASSPKTDVCILGSGVAGMLLADKLLAKGLRVTLVERGEQLSFLDRLRQQSHKDRLPFNADSHRSPHPAAPSGPKERSDRYLFHPVYNLGGSTNHFYGNMPRVHPAHFERRAFGGADRRWPIGYAELEPYYLEAERRWAVSGSSERSLFPGLFDYPLPPHRLSPSDRATERIFGSDAVVPVPTVRPSRPIGTRAACCGSNHCALCPIDSKATALNTFYPPIQGKIDLRSGLLATEIRCAKGLVQAVVAIDETGREHTLTADTFVVACNGVDSCMLLQRSPTVPKHEALGRHYMDHPMFDLVIWVPGLETRPGYGDSAQTGAIRAFFEQVSEKLPVSMFGDVKGATLGEDSGLVREMILRELLARALTAAAGGASFRDEFREAFDSALHLSFLVETQPLASNTLSIQRIKHSGQAVPRIAKAYPVYFAECVSAVIAHVKQRVPEAIVLHRGSLPGVHHWMGATRMAETASAGCVDRDLRYFGLSNLHVLSASTYPASSSASPTLTLTALALRLGDRLGEG